MNDMPLFPQRIKERRPLIHNMTNIVVANFTANGLLAIGASPVMASAKEEVADMAKAADALILNLGTLDTDMIEAMLIAGRSANVHGIPVILDPVGAGATPYRTKVSVKMLKELRVSIVRGNAAEIAQLMGEAGEIKGVDCVESESSLRSPEALFDLAARAADRFGTIVAISGKEDVITDGTTGYVIAGGHPILTSITGSGCLLTSVIGAFAAIESDLLLAGAAAMSYYGCAAAHAYRTAGHRGPGSFQTAFLDALAEIDLFDTAASTITPRQASARRKVWL
ncbi:hydroxyethylthiazole kinase [Paenibacillus sp. KS1]|uniref:hydroxyethylthiazole kinase n=1 Tax=Paenibacillus sp. KS1 TaxID=1849249 RepID=UPI0008065AB0|nr:hydroxyethylthiazole kinase [Paenibacillus sp. KS1]OBY81642.1 hydroxyethylthiazole kinase [Paenibacillus sp. KS1]